MVIPNTKIRLFRQLLKRFLTEKRFSKYLLYAIGEIVLVVIGILIALFLNDLYTDSQNRQSELKYLKRFERDLELNLLEMNRLAIQSDSILVGIDSLMAMHFGEIPMGSTDCEPIGDGGYGLSDFSSKRKYA